MSNDIVVGIDGSPHSDKALRWAIEEAELRGVRVRAVLSWSYMGEGESVLGVGTTEADAQAALDEVITACAGDKAHLVDAVTVNDLAAHGILEQAADALMVVVGSRGRTGLKRVLLGSVSRAVLEKAHVPVVVIPLHD
jgi:nucleotide-binding universal stress UspA family protein